MSRTGRFDHVGITVRDLDAATAFFVGLGLVVEVRMFMGAVELHPAQPRTGIARRHVQ